MDFDMWKRKIVSSPMGRFAAIPTRTKAVLKYDARVAQESMKWLVSSREHTNFTYDLTDLNISHLAWWVGLVTGKPASQAEQWILEIQSDVELRHLIRTNSIAAGRKSITDKNVLLARRVGWYAIVRALRPALVVETGTDKGLGSLVIAAALKRNECVRFVTIDINPECGFLISDPYSQLVDLKIGDSLGLLSELNCQVDLFIHDSDHSAEHERNEFEAIAPWLSSDSVVLSDNSHVTNELMTWAEQSQRTFSFFREEPKNHWYPGAGIGAAWFEKSSS
jgi:hypothetical protein